MNYRFAFERPWRMARAKTVGNNLSEQEANEMANQLESQGTHASVHTSGKNDAGEMEYKVVTGDGADKAYAEDQQQSTIDAKLGLAYESLGIQSEIAGAQIELSEKQLELAQEQWDLYKEIYSPVEKKWAGQALVGIPTDYFVDRAGQEVKQSFDQQQSQYERELQRYGLNPSDPRYAQALSDLALAEAAAEAGIKTNTRLAINDVNYQRMSDVAKTGRGVPTEAASVMSGASNTMSQASNSYSAGYNDVMGAYDAMGAMYGQQASQANQNQQNAAANKAAQDAAMWSGIGALAGSGIQAIGMASSGGASTGATVPGI